MPGIARHTPLLTGNSAVRLVVVDTALLPHVGELLAHLARESEWYEAESAIGDVVASSWEMLDSWYDMAMIGQVSHFVAVAPAGWLPLDGQTYAQADYPELFDKLPSGWVSGSDFTLPDVEDVFLPGVGSGGTIGATGGENQHTLIEAEMPAHTHDYVFPVQGIDIGAAGPPMPSVSTVTPGTPTTSAGSGDPHENRPSFLSLVVAVYAGRD
jgi:microcystin-dependent protein